MMKKHGFLFFTLLLASCSDPLPEWSRDYTIYKNYTSSPYVLSHHESMDFDFYNDYFNEGILTTKDNKTVHWKELYDTMEIFNIEHNTSVKVKKKSEFKYQFTNTNETSEISKIKFYVSLKNSKTNTYSIIFEFGTIYLLPKEENFVNISTIDDFSKIKFSSVVTLSSNIDFSGFNFKDCNLTGTYNFGGCFLNPKKHVIKNIELKDNEENEKRFFFHTNYNAYFDSLIFDNINYTSNSKDRWNRDIFGLLGSFSNRSYYNNIVVNNLNVEISYGIAGSLVGYSEQDSYSNCQINCSIKANESYQENPPLRVVGGLAGYHTSSPLTDYTYWFKNSIFYNFYHTYYPHYQKKKALEAIDKDYIDMPFLFQMKDNRLIVNNSSPFVAGGMFGISDIPNFDSSNLVEGTITGKETGKQRGISFYDYFFYRRNTISIEL